jgi:plasmid maintenance system antidote protein VapI
MQQHHIHIGNLIKERLKEEHKTVVWLAQELGCHRTNVYNIFDKCSLDTNIIRRISIIMQYNFFDYLQEDTQKQIDSCNG